MCLTTTRTHLALGQPKVMHLDLRAELREFKPLIELIARRRPRRREDKTKGLQDLARPLLGHDPLGLSLCQRRMQLRDARLGLRGTQRPQRDRELVVRRLVRHRGEMNVNDSGKGRGARR